MIERESTVLFFKDLYKTLSVLSDADAGILMKALFAHANGLEHEGLEKSPMANLAYIGAADQMDRLENYRKNKAESGRVGGSKPKQTKANESKVKQTKANESEPERTEPPYPSPYPYPNPSPSPYHKKAIDWRSV